MNVEFRSMSHNSSENNLNISNNIYGQTKKRQVRRPREEYVHKNRISRYNNAFQALWPIRRTEYSAIELPIGNIGCLANTTFSWVNKFRISKAASQQLKAKQTTLINNELNFNKLPKTPLTDGSKINGLRFLGKFKDERQDHGIINGSMFRVARTFCRTRIIFSCFIQIIAIIIGLLGPTIFCKFILDSMNMEKNLIQRYNKDSNYSNTNQTTKLHEQYLKDRNKEEINRLIYTLCIFLFFICSNFLQGICNWLNLRTAIRLRTGLISAVYKKIMDCSVYYKKTPQEILSLVNEESDVIILLVLNGTYLFSSLIGIILSIGLVLKLLKLYGLLTTVSVIGLCVVTSILSLVSRKHFLTSILHSINKCKVIEEYCINFKNIIALKKNTLFEKIFDEIIKTQYSAWKYNEIFSNNYTGTLSSSILLGALYLIWCDVNITTESISVLIVIIIYAYFIKNLLLEYCDAILAITRGICCLDRIKNILALKTVTTKVNKLNNDGIAIIINNAKYQWDDNSKDNKLPEIKNKFTLIIEDLVLEYEKITGITGPSGSGKTTLLYSILGHTVEIAGSIKMNGSIAFFPKIPFLINNSIKDNIIMEDEFRHQDFINAISSAGLTSEYNSMSSINNENEEEKNDYVDQNLPINAYIFNKRIIYKILIARALYSKREIFLFDDPMYDIDMNDELNAIFCRAIDAMLIDKKTILLITQKENLLKKCTNIYYLNEGTVYRHIDKINNIDNIERIPSLDPIFNENKKYTACISNYNIINGSNEQDNNYEMEKEIRDDINMILDNDETKKKINLSLTIWNFFLLIFLHLINITGYYALPLGFIYIVKKEYVEPWLAYISIGIMISSFTTNFLIKVLVSNISENLSKNIQKTLFSCISKATINYFYTTKLSSILKYFADELYITIQYQNQRIYYAISVFLSASLLIYTNYWTVLVIFIIVMIYFGIYMYLKYTYLYYNQIEDDTKQTLYSIATNNMRGRAVLKSFDMMLNFDNEFYIACENNSTSIFLQKSIIFYGQFLLNIAIDIGLLSCCLILIYVPFTKLSMYHFIFGIFVYYSFSYNLNKLLSNGLFMSAVSKQKTEKLNIFIQDITIKNKNKTAIEIKDLNKGVCIVFDNILFRANNKNLIKINNKLYVQNGEKFGIQGEGCDFIVPIMMRLLELTDGSIFLSDNNITTLSDSYLQSIIGIIPFDFQLCDMTIESFFASDIISNQQKTYKALKYVNMWDPIHKLRKLFKEPIKNLYQHERQLLFLAKCYIQNPSILIIERPLPQCLDIINSCIKSYFFNTTIIIIGSSYSQFAACDRIFDLSKQN